MKIIIICLSLLMFISVSYIDGSDKIITGTVTDQDGDIYKTVKIGNQWWMAENLRVTHNTLGKEIKTYYPNGNSDNVTVYGRLYSWDVAMDGSKLPGARGIAPKGWHIPDDKDWKILFDFLGGMDIAGGKMKESGTIHWKSKNVGATNTSGFTSLPSGGFIPPGEYHGFSFAVHYWSSTENGIRANWPSIMYNDKNVYILSALKKSPVAIRCVKD